MSTRGRIGIELENGKTLSVYSHWDNEPKWNGAILLLYYNTKEKVQELISHGYMSSLGTLPGDDEPHSFYERKRENKFGFEKLCTFYHRDRGDKFIPADEMTRKEMRKQEEYAYLWRNGRWWYSSYKMNRFYPLGDKKCGITKEMREVAKKELAE